jgi:acyl-coenzyme A synthetase/AMP-(fatty) acid ligase
VSGTELTCLRAERNIRGAHPRAWVHALGSKIATGPIEQAMQDRLGVEGVCILSMPGDGGDEEVHAVIQSRRAVGRAELEALAGKELRGFHRVHFHVFEQLPRNAMGKVVRFELRRMLLARGGAAKG